MSLSAAKNNKDKDAMSSTAVVRNILATFAQFSLRFFVGIWFTRFLIHNLGTELYGLVPLAWSLTQYFALITVILNAPSARYLMIEMSRNRLDSANNIFNTVFWGLGGLSLILLVVGASVSWSTPFIFKVPAGHEADARFIFLAATGAFVITTFSSPFALSTYVTNRLDLRSLNESFQLIIRVGAAFIFISFLGWRLGAVSTGILVAALMGLLITIILWRKLTPELSLKKPQINMPMMKEISSTGGWMLVTHLGALFFLNSELFIVNFLYGADLTGRYGALLVFPTVFRSFAQMISSTLTPSVIDRYAKDDIDGIIRFVCRSIRLLGLLIALPLGLLCGFSFNILNIWLGSNFTNLSSVVIILSAHLCVNLAFIPVFSLNVMANKVKIPGLVTLLMGIINVLLAVILGLPKFGFGLIGIAMAGAIVLTLKNAVFTPLYGAHILKANKSVFFPSIVTGITGFLSVLVSSFIVLKALEITNIYNLLTAFIIVSLVYLALVWFFILNTEDKDWLQSNMPIFNKFR